MCLVSSGRKSGPRPPNSSDPNSRALWTLGPTDCQWIRDPSTTGSRFNQKWTHQPRSMFSRPLVVSQPLADTKNRYRYSIVIPVLEPPPVLETRIRYRLQLRYRILVLVSKSHLGTATPRTR